jgi:hypothetical protein
MGSTPAGSVHERKKNMFANRTPSLTEGYQLSLSESFPQTGRVLLHLPTYARNTRLHLGALISPGPLVSAKTSHESEAGVGTTIQTGPDTMREQFTVLANLPATQIRGV